jgi:hypothetical protein
MPDVMQRAGCTMVEVGATNRTHLRDFAAVTREATRAYLKVHPSNFRMEGFVGTPSLAELVELARPRGLLVLDDLGSGFLCPVAIQGLEHEPRVADSLAAGATITCFSGDKLLGGPQCGILLGSAEAIAACRAHPLYRALRCDKLTLAALEAVLQIYRDGEPLVEIPTLRMLSAGRDELRERAPSWRVCCGARTPKWWRASRSPVRVPTRRDRCRASRWRCPAATPKPNGCVPTRRSGCSCAAPVAAWCSTRARCCWRIWPRPRRSSAAPFLERADATDSRQAPHPLRLQLGLSRQAAAGEPRAGSPEALAERTSGPARGQPRLRGCGGVPSRRERALVQTVDFFPPICDDPRWFGRIAAANALSDVYAMGGRPVTVMNLVGWPKELDLELLGEVLARRPREDPRSGCCALRRPLGRRPGGQVRPVGDRARASAALLAQQRRKARRRAAADEAPRHRHGRDRDQARQGKAGAGAARHGADGDAEPGRVRSGARPRRARGHRRHRFRLRRARARDGPGSRAAARRLCARPCRCSTARETWSPPA